MENWYFTFGFGQPHEGKYIKFTGTWDEAREKMVNAFGMKWAFQYSEEQKAECIDAYGLEEIH